MELASEAFFFTCYVEIMRLRECRGDLLIRVLIFRGGKELRRE